MAKGAQTFDETSRRVGARVRELRLAKGLTQEALVHRVGIDLRRYQRLEAGELNPTLRTLWLIAVNGLGVDVSELMPPSTRK